MSTAQEIEDAIRALPASERDKLMRHIPSLFPEFADEEWQRIINDERPRPVLNKLLNETEAALRRDPDAFPKMKARDFDASS